MAHRLLGGGAYIRARNKGRNLWTRIKSDQPSPSVHECHLRLRQLQPLQAHDWNEASVILLPILDNPRKFSLPMAFVLAAQWHRFKPLQVPGVGRYAGKTFGNIVERDPSRLVARDKFRECQRLEASLTPILRAARCGDFDTFKAGVDADPKVLDETDSINNGIWFWALTGGDVRIIDYLLQYSVSLHWPRGRNVLHQAMYASPQTVEYILSKPGIFSMINRPDCFSEYNQWGVFYYETALEEKKWIAVKICRNRMDHRWMAARRPGELKGLVTIKFEGEGDELDTRTQSELDNEKAHFCSEKPDRYPLHCAIEAGNQALIGALLRNGALVNAKDGFGMTPLHTAAKWGHEHIVQMLCNSGADPTLLDNTNSRALDVALDNDHRHIQQLMNQVAIQELSID